MNNPVYHVAVIGAGPAGIKAVSELAAQNYFPILWIDPVFDCGDLVNYTNISSNSDVTIKELVIQQNTWINKNNIQDQFLHFTQGIPKKKYVQLNICYETLRMMQQMLIFQYATQIKVVKSMAVEYQQENNWKIITQDQQEFEAVNIFMCTGSICKDIKLQQPDLFSLFPHIEFLPLMNVICPIKIQKYNLKDDVIAIFGRSSSGILILRELMALSAEKRPKKFYLFYKGEIKWFKELNDGKLQYIYSGLRGEAAEWAKCHLKPNIDRDIEEIEFTEENIKLILPQCTKAVSAIGFQRRTLGQIILKNGNYIQDQDISYDGQDCYLYYKNRNKLEGIYGFGIAFPERWIDPSGIIDDKIGIYGFQECIQKVINSGQLKKIE